MTDPPTVQKSERSDAPRRISYYDGPSSTSLAPHYHTGDNCYPNLLLGEGITERASQALKYSLLLPLRAPQAPLPAHGPLQQEPPRGGAHVGHASLSAGPARPGPAVLRPAGLPAAGMQVLLGMFSRLKDGILVCLTPFVAAVLCIVCCMCTAAVGPCAHQGGVPFRPW